MRPLDPKIDLKKKKTYFFCMNMDRTTAQSLNMTLFAGIFWSTCVFAWGLLYLIKQRTVSRMCAAVWLHPLSKRPCNFVVVLNNCQILQPTGMWRPPSCHGWKPGGNRGWPVHWTLSLRMSFTWTSLPGECSNSMTVDIHDNEDLYLNTHLQQ